MVAFFAFFLFFQSFASDTNTSDFNELRNALKSNIYTLNNPKTISVKSVEDVLTAAENLQEFIADNFLNLFDVYNKQDIIDIYTKLNQLSATNIFADKIANLKTADLSQLDLDASGIWQHTAAEETIYGTIENAQREVQKTKDIIAVVINNFYRISFLVAKKRIFFSSEEKKLIFISLSLKEILNPNSVSSDGIFNDVHQALLRLNEILMIRTSFINAYRDELTNFETNQLIDDFSNDLQIMAFV